MQFNAVVETNIHARHLYDPVLLTADYTIERHLSAFERMARNNTDGGGLYTEKLKRYQKLLIIAASIVFLPLIVFEQCRVLLQIPKKRRIYKKSRYYADFKKKFSQMVLNSLQYRFYNSAVTRGLPMQYVYRESDGLEYFIYHQTLFLFPDFDQLELSEEGVW